MPVLPLLLAQLVAPLRSSAQEPLQSAGLDVCRIESPAAVAVPPRRSLFAELSLSNDGNGDTGQFRAVAVLAGEGLLVEGDELVLVGELNSTSDPRLGYREAALSYSVPVGDRLSFSAAVAASRRQPMDLSLRPSNLSDSQQQVYGELEITLWDPPDGRLIAFAGVSANRNQASGFQSRWLSSGYGRAGLALEAWPGSIDLSASAYGLQAIPAFSSNLAEARALAADLRLGWSLAPGLHLELQGAAQWAFAPLTQPMGFTLGSDSGLRGLPGQVESGDSGVLGYGEVSWRIWRRGSRQLQLVPFLGAGWVSSAVAPGASRSASVGAGGVLLRWLHGRQWLVELGWSSPFGRIPDGAPSHGLLDDGLYTRVRYRL